MTVKKNGKTLYPVGGWQRNQHKMFNYNDKMYNYMCDSGYADECVEAFEESERLLDAFNNGVRNDGLVYVEYEDYKKIKEIISYYDATH